MNALLLIMAGLGFLALTRLFQLIADAVSDLFADFFVALCYLSGSFGVALIAIGFVATLSAVIDWV